MIRVDLRIVTLTVPPQEVITRDNVTVKVTAVVYFYVVNPEHAVVNVMNYLQATTQIGQTTLRNVLGQSELDELLSQRNKINRELQAIIDEHTERWGVKVTAVEVKDIELPSTMQRAMAKQAEAEREKRAKLIHAEGEFAASQRLADAAKILGSEAAALQLRYLQTLSAFFFYLLGSSFFIAYVLLRNDMWGGLAAWWLQTADLVLASGGGQLDAVWGGTWGQPYALARWAWLARRARVPSASAAPTT